jgi:hypothetical protein
MLAAGWTAADVGDLAERLLAHGWQAVAVAGGVFLVWRFLAAVERQGWPWRPKGGA